MLIRNWRDVLARAWSIRLMALSAILSGAEAALQFGWNPLALEPGVYPLFAAVAAALAGLARLVIQSNLPEA